MEGEGGGVGLHPQEELGSHLCQMPALLAATPPGQLCCSSLLWMRKLRPRDRRSLFEDHTAREGRAGLWLQSASWGCLGTTFVGVRTPWVDCELPGASPEPPPGPPAAPLPGQATDLVPPKCENEKSRRAPWEVLSLAQR